MAFTPLAVLVRKDLKLFFSDRRAVAMSFAVPILIASFFGAIFSGVDKKGEPARIAVSVIDLDGSAISKGILAGAQADKNFRITTPTTDEATDAVKRGTMAVAVIIPKNFGDAAGKAFFGTGEKPPLEFLYDPSRGAELAMVRGIFTQHVMQAVSQEMFGGAQGRAMVEQSLPQIESSGMADDQKRALTEMLKSVQKFYGQQAAQGAQPAGPPQGLSMPYTVTERAVTSGKDVVYNSYAHSFAGMGIQFILFAAIDLGIGILMERERGLWKRLRSAPISRLTLLLGKMTSGAILTLASLLVSFGFAIVVFGVRIEGSVAGFLSIAVASALMASTFGLLLASVGRTPGATRGFAILAVLMMVMLGGAWIPAFIFPAWLQQATLVVPVRWAVDGLDAMTWRGLPLSSAVMPTGVLLGFAILFGTLAVTRFRWEEA